MTATMGGPSATRRLAIRWDRRLGVLLPAALCIACSRVPVPEQETVSAQQRPEPPAAEDFQAPEGPFDFELTTTDGHPLRLSALRGSVVLVNFWATWCAPCRREIDTLVDLYRRRGDRPFEIVGVSVDTDPTALAFWLRLKKLPYPVVVADDSVRARFGLTDRVPVTFLLDRDGRTVKAYPGSPRDLGLFERDLEAVLAAARTEAM